MKQIIFIITFLLVIISFSRLSSQQREFNLVEEDKIFWSQILNDSTVTNKNMLYAGYVAYKENLNDLSMETFKEYININSSNRVVVTIAYYYLAKNLYLIGKYNEAALEFINISKSDSAKYNEIKFGSMINAAIVYHKLNNIEKFRENLQNVIAGDIEGKYKKIALDILSQQ